MTGYDFKPMAIYSVMSHFAYVICDIHISNRYQCNTVQLLTAVSALSVLLINFNQWINSVCDWPP